ncbi:MAG: 4'-phosphopantetheinyl transferase superfamily protein [Burkholderiales bacterium]
MPPPAPGVARAPTQACVVLDAPDLADDTTVEDLLAQVRQALTSDAPAVVVLCAAGEPVLRAREQLRALDRVLAPLARSLSARVSRSATDGLAAWAASRIAPIGVDVQGAPGSLEPDLVEAALHPDEAHWLAAQTEPEQAFAALWSAKEAVLKAFGVGLAWSPREVLAAPVAAGWRALQVGALGHAWLTHLRADAAPSVALAVALNAGHTAPG